MSDEQQCSLLGQIVSTRKNGIEVHLCGHFKKGCTVEDHGIKTPSGAMPVCAGCPFKTLGAPPILDPKSAWPLGDQVETALSSVGITKERVSKWLGKPCSCPERQAKLNAIGNWAAGFAKGLLGKSDVEKIVG